jgi:hypothetical protein
MLEQMWECEDGTGVNAAYPHCGGGFFFSKGRNSIPRDMEATGQGYERHLGRIRSRCWFYVLRVVEF